MERQDVTQLQAALEKELEAANGTAEGSWRAVSWVAAVTVRVSIPSVSFCPLYLLPSLTLI